MTRRDFFQATPVGHLIEADEQLEIAELYQREVRQRQAESRAITAQGAFLKSDPQARQLLHTLPRFREVWTTPGTHFAVRAEGHIVRVIVGPKGGIRTRPATTEELTTLAGC